jgi:hypothetical protein
MSSHLSLVHQHVNPRGSLTIQQLHAAVPPRCHSVLREHTADGGSLQHPLNWHDLWLLADGWAGEPPQRCRHRHPFRRSLASSTSNGLTAVVEDHTGTMFLVRGVWV